MTIAEGEAAGRAIFRQEKRPVSPSSVLSVRSVVKTLSLVRDSDGRFALIKACPVAPNGVEQGKEPFPSAFVSALSSSERSACPALTFLMMGLHIRSDNDHFIHHDPNNGPWKSGCMGTGG